MQTHPESQRVIPLPILTIYVPVTLRRLRRDCKYLSFFLCHQIRSQFRRNFRVTVHSLNGCFYSTVAQYSLRQACDSLSVFSCISKSITHFEKLYSICLLCPMSPQVLNESTHLISMIQCCLKPFLDRVTKGTHHCTARVKVC